MSTVRLHRFLKAPPERVYKAFLDPEAKAKWLPPHGFTGKVHRMDARVGGGYKMSFTTLELKAVMTGTELSIVQEGLPPQIPVEFAYLGWQESLTLLAYLVEPEIPATP